MFDRLVLFLILGLAVGCPARAIAQPGTGPAPVETSSVIQIRHAGEKTFVGSLFPTRSAVIGSAVDGRVLEVLVDAGDPVGMDPAPPTEDESVEGGESNGDSAATAFRGQPIVKLRTNTLDIEIEAAKIKLRQSEQLLAELEVALPADLDIADSTVTAARNELEFARSDFEISQRLREQSRAVSEIELLNKQNVFLTAQQNLRTAELQLEKLRGTSEVRLSQARLQVSADRQELVRLADLRAKYILRAPFKGVVTEKLTEVGAWLSQGEDVARILQLDPIEMVVNVPQEYVTDLRGTVGSDVVIDIEGIDQVVTGSVVRVVPQLDLRSRSIPIRLQIDNPEDGSGGYLLQPGMLGTARFAIGEPLDMNLVKKDVLVLESGRASVFKVVERDGGQFVTAVPVRVGVAVGQWIQIEGDIAKGDTVILMGNERLRNGQAIRVIRRDEATVPDSVGS